MTAAVSPHEAPAGPVADLSGIRVAGGIGLRVQERGGRSVAADVLERDGYKVRFPRGAPHLEAVIINTGGGLAGGDRVHQTISLGDGARATVTTQAAERVYRALGESETRIDTQLSLGENARLDWLPQETILFDKSRLQRSIEVDMGPSARLLLAETVIFGRTAMGEAVHNGLLCDRWRIRRGGTLVFAETVRLDGDIDAMLKAAAIAGGAHVVATFIGIGEDSADQLDRVRAAFAGAECEAGASAWNGRLVVRVLGRSSESVRRMVERVIPILSDAPLPRVWHT